MKKDLAIIMAERQAKYGVAFSQTAMGRWDERMYVDRCREIEAEFKRELRENYP